MKKSHVVMRARASHFLNEQHAAKVPRWRAKRPYVDLAQPKAQR